MPNANRLRSRRLPFVFCLLVLHACGSDDGASPPKIGDAQAPASVAPPQQPSQVPTPSSTSTTPAAATPSPAPTPTPQPEPVGTVRYVTPSSSAARDNGAGTAAAPYKTISYAITQLRPGETLLIGSGTYREAVDLRQATYLRSTNTARTKIAAAAGANVVIKGSDVVSGWQRTATNTFVRRNWRVNSQQVFVDGAPLKQIGGSIYGGFPDKPGNPYATILAGTGGIWPGRVKGNASSLVDKSFYYDAATESLYVRFPVMTLDGHTVEVSTRTYAIFGSDVHDLTFERLRVEHSNTTATVQNGAITLLGARLTLDRLDVKYADGAGFDITANDSIVRNVTANYCGQVGIKLRGSRSQLLDSVASYNHTRGFNKWWEAGGAKFVGAGGLQDSVVAGNHAYFNAGDGLWFDYKNNRNKIHENFVAYNTGMGIHYEASSGAQIYRNRIFGNGQRGVYLPNSSKSVVAHNLIVCNGLEGIAIVDERGASARNDTPFIPVDNYVVANVIGWNGKAAITLPGEGEPAHSDANLFLGDTQPTFSLGWPSAARPLFVGIPAWLSGTQHDGESWYKAMAIPAQLARELAAKNTAANFASIDAIADTYTVPVARLPKPVPLLTKSPGP